MGGLEWLRKAKVVIESLPGALASHVCHSVCRELQRIYKRDGAYGIAVQCCCLCDCTNRSSQSKEVSLRVDLDMAK